MRTSDLGARSILVRSGEPRPEDRCRASSNTRGTAPDRPALLLATGETATFGELGTLAHQLARAFTELGLAPADTVAVIMENRPEYVATFAAAVESGLNFVGVNWHLTAAEIAYILTDSETKCLIASPAHAATALEAADSASIPPLGRICIDATEGFVTLADLVAKQPAEPPEHREAGQALFYTSGTTGKPKGVRKKIQPVPPERIRLSTAIGTPEPPDVDQAAPSDAVHLVGAPLYHAAPLAGVATPLDAGAAVVLMERWTAGSFLALVERHRVTHAWMVPRCSIGFWRWTTTCAPKPTCRLSRRSCTPGPLCCGGQTADDRLVRPHRERGLLVHRRRRHADQRRGMAPKAGQCGSADGTGNGEGPRRGRPGVSPGRRGSRLHGPDPVGVRVPARPAEDRRGASGGLFTVGDIGYFDDEGYLFLCDRVAEVIVSGGVNIYPAEVENIFQSHRAVADAAVVGVPNDEWGEEVRGIVELRSGVTDDPATEAALIEHCRSQLAHYKCPRAIDFVETLGRDPNGKVRKRVLREPYWAGRDRRI